MTPQEDFVMKTINSRDIHFVRFWFTDVLGNMKSFAVSPSEVQHAFANGMGFDGSCIAGFASSEESDMLAFPDASTFQVLPWRPTSNAVARMFCSIRHPDGAAFEGDPRRILERMVNAAAEKGYVVNAGSELEFYYFKNGQRPEVLDCGGYFDLTTLDSATDLRRETVLMLENMGIPVEYSHHERGPSQNEIDLRFTDALSMADAVMTYKLVVKEIAIEHGVHASFMPMPFAHHPGNGMHVHQSLFDDEGNNVFYDPADPLGYNLSDVAKHYIAGLLHYAPEFALITNQYVNSYKRLNSCDQAPKMVTWSYKNRAALVRIPGYRPSSEEACRIEFRNPDPASNPYLVFALMIAAGLEGIEKKLALPPATNFKSTDPKTSTLTPLPTNLGEAIAAFEHSEFAHKVLGDHVFSYLLRAKKEEWSEYQKMVSQWEIDRYLPTL